MEVFVTVLGAVVASLATLVTQLFEQRRARSDESSFEDKVEAAAEALRDGAAVVAELQAEIQARADAVAELQRQHKLLELDPAQIEAVSALLQGSAQKESRRAI